MSMMLRAVSVISIECKALEFIGTARRDVFKLFRASAYSTTTSAKTVLEGAGGHRPPEEPPPLAPAAPPLPPPPPTPRRPWAAVAAALALTASLVGGVYVYRKYEEGDDSAAEELKAVERTVVGPRPEPASAAAFPQRVDFLLVGAGTASFAAMRALRSARPEAQVLMVGEELQLPYMRPPLSKELWREPRLPRPHDDLDALSFSQWNGRRRSVTYEPKAFYTPVEELAARGEGVGGVSVARGWRVERLHVERHEAELRAPGREAALVRYGRCLVATGVRPRRCEALRVAADAGKSFTLRTLQDAARLAEALESAGVRRVAVVGGGLLAAELSAALAERPGASASQVHQLFREGEPLAGLLPAHLAADAGRRLRLMGVQLHPQAEVCSSSVDEQGVRLRLASGEELLADLVVECVGSELEPRLAQRSDLETHPELGGLLVNAELQARSDVFAAGDAACFHDVALGRRRVEHHDHAVVSGRLAGENMAGLRPPRPYTHQSMFWSDLGPQLGYEAIGIIDSRLATVSVFSAEAVSAEGAARVVGETQAQPEASARRYERGVVFYLRGQRVVGVLLWNLFNRMHVARQVLAQGEFEDLFEVAKLFSLHEDD